MLPINRIQAYLRHNAHQQYQAVSVPPFTCFFHRTDPLPYFNYAIPAEPCGGDLTQPLAELRRVFQLNSRQPRFEFIEQYAPELPAALDAAGFVEVERQQGMLCTPGSYRPAPAVPGLGITALTSSSPLEAHRHVVTVQRAAFDPDNQQPVTHTEAQSFAQDLQNGAAFLAQLDGRAVCVGMFTNPFDGLTEMVGIATLPAFRRWGIGTALVGAAVLHAFSLGLESVYLTAADQRAGRVYERVGFVPCATMLTYAQLTNHE
jgi:GNAT superfamily N-acetyltransferase